MMLPAFAAQLTCTLTTPNGSSAYLMVLPRVVQVSVGPGGVVDPLRLEVVAQSKHGNPIDPGALTWSSSPAGASFAQQDDAAVVTLPASIPAGSVVLVTASNGMQSGTSSITVVAMSGGALDEARSDHTAGDNPAVSLTSGESATGCTFDATSAFAVAAPVGPWIGTTGCGRSEAAVFTSAGQPFIVEAMAWTTGPDVVDATNNAGPRDIPLQVVIGVPAAHAATAESAMAGYLLLAGDTYWNMRVGVAFPPSMQTTIVTPLSPTFDSCEGIGTLQDSVKPDPAKLNIYMIESVAGSLRGFFCAPNVLLVSRVSALATTLSHELSHALGLIAQSFGHIDSVHGFNTDNVMSGSMGPSGDMRYRLTLGQLYRMHRDGRSWLKRAADGTPGPLLCPCDPYANASCPVLSTDLRPVVGTPATPFPSASCTP